MKDAEVKYSTVQNWYPGDKDGNGGIYNFVTKRGICRGENARLSWTQIETGSALTWKYPSCILAGDRSVGEFYSVAVTNNHQQADTGTKMIHLGRDTRSRIVSKGISAGVSPEQLPGTGQGIAQGRGDAQLLAVRLAAYRRPVRGAHVSLYRGEQPLGRRRARGDHVEDRGGSALLLQSEGAFDRGCRRADRQRLCEGGAQQAADGICRRGSEAVVDQSGR